MLITLMKIRLEIMLSDFAEKKETCFDYKNRIFQSQKIRFSKAVIPCFWSKYGNYLVHLNFVKIRLEIMLGNFAEKKETCFDYKK